ncbi:hypothetical protein B0H11DRAFT_2216629 [Mycena galericulata]|nr:hypothetical protein B0H11DRAFT_2216629 [Mycena galericulata]
MQLEGDDLRAAISWLLSLHTTQYREAAAKRCPRPTTTKPPPRCRLQYALLTTTIVVSGFTIAFFVNDLQLVLSFVGSTGSTMVSFILPELFYWQLTRGDRNRNKLLSLAALALVVYGMFVFVSWCVSLLLPRPSTLTDSRFAVPAH